MTGQTNPKLLMTAPMINHHDNTSVHFKQNNGNDKILSRVRFKSLRASLVHDIKSFDLS